MCQFKLITTVFLANSQRNATVTAGSQMVTIIGSHLRLYGGNLDLVIGNRIVIGTTIGASIIDNILVSHQRIADELEMSSFRSILIMITQATIWMFHVT